MNGVGWKDLQKKWQHERQELFPAHLPVQSQKDSPPALLDKDLYIILYTTIVDGMYNFDSQEANPLVLRRNTTYIFDQSDSSNHGHALCISRHPAKGQVRDIGLQGNPGSPGALLSIYIGDGRPTDLFYYDAMHSGRSGSIQLSD